MKQLDIQSSIGESKILVGESLKNISHYLPSKKTAIITDTNVRRLYGHLFPAGLVIEIAPGEANKTMQAVSDIIGQLLAEEFDRSCFILGIGGGIVCDVTGFVASVFMRGVDFGFVSTTLLAQVDASVGGKNGVNFEGLKNMIGVFALPQFVICDMEMLRTLPKEEILSGFAEIVKHGAIADLQLFDFIDNNYEKALELDTAVIERFVYDSLVIKSTVVSGDAREKGERRKLNFGHTFGHAVEKVTKMPHGMAVSVGMVVATELSVKRGLMKPEMAARMKTLLNKLQLPTTMEGIDQETAMAAMKRDKKREGDTMHFILLETIGRAVIKEISLNELKDITNDLCSNTGKGR